MSHDNTPITDPDSHVDEWFKHDANEPHHQESHGQFNNTGIFITLGATILGTLLVSVVVIIWVNGLVNETKTDVQENSPRLKSDRVGFFSEWDKQLYDGPEWIDQNAGSVRLPVERASAKVIERYAEDR